MPSNTDLILAGAEIDDQLARYGTSDLKTTKLNELARRKQEKLQTLSNSAEEPDADSNAQYRLLGGDSAEVAHNIAPTGDTKNQRSKVYKQVAYMNNIPISEAIAQVDREFPAVDVDPNLPNLIATYRQKGLIPKDFNMTSWDIYNAGIKDYNAALKDKQLHPKTAFDNYAPFDTGNKGYFKRNLVDNKAFVDRQIAQGHMTPGSNDWAEYQNQLKSYSNAKANGLGNFSNNVDPRVMDAILKTSYSFKHFNMANHPDIDPSENKQFTINKVLNTLKQRESSNRYNVQNEYGYIGAYQFGAARLSDLGIVKKGTKNKDLDNPDVWTGKYGIKSKYDFLGSPDVQDRIATEHLSDLQKQLEGSATSQQDLMGKIFAAHLLGVNGSKNLNTTDANNTSGLEYYKLGAGLVAPTTSPKRTDTVGTEDLTNRAVNLAEGGAASIGRSLWGVADATLQFGGQAAADTIRLFDEDNSVADMLDNADLGSEDTKRIVSNELAGYDDSLSRKNMAKLKSIWDSVAEKASKGKTSKELSQENAYEKWRDWTVKNTDKLAKFTEKVPALNQITAVIAGINSRLNAASWTDIKDSLTTAVNNPETTVESFGDILVMVMGKGKGITTLNKSMRLEKIAAIKAKDAVSKAKHLTNLADLKKQRLFIDKASKVVSDNLGVAAISASYVNASEEAFKKRYGREKTWGERLGDMVATTLFNKLDEVTAVSSIKGVKSVANQFSKLQKFVPDNAFAKLGHALLSSTARLGTAGVKEFFQELTQETQQTMIDYDLIGDNFEVKPVDPKELKEILSGGLIGGFAGFGSGIHMASPSVAKTVVPPAVSAAYQTTTGVLKLASSPMTFITNKIGKSSEMTEGKAKKLLQKGIDEVNYTIENVAPATEGVYKQFDIGKQYSDEEAVGAIIDIVSTPQGTKGTPEQAAFLATHKDLVDSVLLAFGSADKPEGKIAKFIAEHQESKAENRTETLKSNLTTLFKDLGGVYKNIDVERFLTGNADTRKPVEQQLFNKAIAVHLASSTIAKALNGSKEANVSNVNTEEDTAANVDSVDKTVVDNVEIPVKGNVTPNLNSDINTEEDLKPVEPVSTAEVTPTTSATELTAYAEAKVKNVLGNTAASELKDISFVKNTPSSVEGVKSKVVKKTDKKAKRIDYVPDETFAEITADGNFENLNINNKNDSKVQDLIQKFDGITSKGQKVRDVLSNLYKKLTNKETAAADMRGIAIVANQVYSSTKSAMHEALNEGSLILPEGAAAYKLEHQIGKDYVNSYGVKLENTSPTKLARAYVAIGRKLINKAVDLDVVEKLENQPIHNVNLVNETGDRIESQDLADGLGIQKTNEGTFRGTIIKMKDVNRKSKTSFDINAYSSVLGEAFKQLSPLLTPGNLEVPHTNTDFMLDENYEVTDDSGWASDAEKEQVKTLQGKPLQINKAMFKKLSGWAKKYRNDAVSTEQSIYSFVANNVEIAAWLGIDFDLLKTDNFLSESLKGSAWARLQNFRDILDNIEALSGDDDGNLYFEYKIDINDRISLVNSILNFQHDNIIARHIMSTGKYNVKKDSKEFRFIVAELADELGITAQEVLGTTVTSNTKQIDKANNNNMAMVKKLPLFASISSGFKVKRLLEGIKDVRQVNEKKQAEITYMAGMDASASGVKNTLINLLPYTESKEELESLKSLLESFGVSFDGKLDKGATKDPYTYLLEILKGLNNEGKGAYDRLNTLASSVGMKIRDFAKYPVMTWFYGQLDTNTQLMIGNDIIVKLFKIALNVNKDVTKAQRDSAIAALNEATGGSFTDATIKLMTQEDYTKAVAYYRDSIGINVTEALAASYPSVVRYRKETTAPVYNRGGKSNNTLYSVLSSILSDVWSGEFPSAVGKAVKWSTENVLHKEYDTNTKGYIRVHKAKNVLLQSADGSKAPVIAQRAVKNATSLGVNPQHAVDAALLLGSLVDLADVGVMTVHDAIYGRPSDLLTAQKIYNALYLRIAADYSFYEQGLELVKELKAVKAKDSYSGKQEVALDTFIEMLDDKVKKAAEVRKELITDSSKASIFGLSEKDVEDSFNVTPASKSSPTPPSKKSKTSIKEARELPKVQMITGEELTKGNYVVLDTETTGISDKDIPYINMENNKYTGEVHEVSAVKYDKNGKLLEEKTWSINKDKLNGDFWTPYSKGNEDIQKANKYRDEIRKRKFTELSDFNTELSTFLGTDIAIMKNAKFDVAALRDTANFTFKKDQARDYKSNSQDTNIKALENTGVLMADGLAHTAKIDVENTNTSLRKLDFKKEVNKKINAAWESIKKDISGKRKVKTILAALIKNQKELELDEDIINALKELNKKKSIVDIKIFNNKDNSFSYSSAEGISINTKKDAHTFVNYLLHEIAHDQTLAYITQNPEADEVKYLQKVLDKLKSINFDDVEKRLSPEVVARVKRISAEKNNINQIAELAAVLVGEPNVARAISMKLFKKRRQSFIKLLLKKAKAIIQKAFKFAENEEITYEKTAEALESIISKNNDSKAGLTSEQKANAELLPSKHTSILGLLDLATLGLLGVAGQVLKTYVAPAVGVLHRKAYRNMSLYKGFTNLIKEGIYNSDLANELKASLGVDDTVDKTRLNKLATIWTSIQQESNTILSEKIPAMRQAINQILTKKADQQVLNRVISDTSIVHLFMDKKLENKIFNNDLKSVENELKDRIENVLTDPRISQKFNTTFNGSSVEDVANMYAEAYVKGIPTKVGLTNAQSLFNDNEITEVFNQYVALLAVQKVNRGLEVLKKVKDKDKELYNIIKEVSIVVKATSDAVNGINAGATRGSSKIYSEEFDGNYIMDVSSSLYEHKLVPAHVNNSLKYSEKDGWMKVPHGKQGAHDMFVRKIGSEFKQEGLGLSTDRFINGTLLATEDVENWIKRDPDFLEKNYVSNTMVNGIPRYRVHVSKEVKRKYLDSVEDLAESLYRTAVQHKNVIESDSARQLVKNEATLVLTPKSVDWLVSQIRKGRNGIKLDTPMPMLLKFDTNKFDADFVMPKEITSYYKVPSNRISTYNGFSEGVDYIAKNIEHIVTDGPSTMFTKNLGKTAKNIEKVWRHIISMYKIRLISSPQKLIGDLVANSALLSDVPFSNMVKSAKEYKDELPKLAAIKSKLINLELAELAEPGKHKKEIAKVKRQLETSVLYPMLKHGFLQSISTGMVLKDFESIQGLQKDINNVLDKVLNERDTKGNFKHHTAIGTIFKVLSEKGFKGESILKLFSNITGGKNTIVGNELQAMAKRLERIKKDEDLIAYVSEYLGSPSSELMRQTTNVMTNIDGVSRWILWKHLTELFKHNESALWKTFRQDNSEVTSKKDKKWIDYKSNKMEEIAEIVLYTFVDYRINMPKLVAALSGIGILMFPNFWMKYQRTLFNMVKNNPFSAVGGYTLDSLIGASHAHPLSALILNKAVEGTLIGGANVTVGTLANPLYFAMP